MSGQLILIEPPNHSPSAKAGLYHFDQNALRVRAGEGRYALEWFYSGPIDNMDVNFALKSYDDDQSFHDIASVTVPAIPMFSIIGAAITEMIPDRKIEPSSLKEMQRKVVAQPEKVGKFMDGVGDQTKFLKEVLGEWLEDGPALDELVKTLYTGISADMCMIRMLKRGGPAPDFTHK